MSYDQYIGRTAMHFGVVERDTRGAAKPPRRNSWARRLECEAEAKERAKPNPNGATVQEMRAKRKKPY